MRVPFEELTVSVVTPQMLYRRPPPPRRQPGDPSLYRAIAAVWETGRRLRTTRHFPAGVPRHATIESMNRQREAWDDEYFRAIRASRPR